MAVKRALDRKVTVRMDSGVMDRFVTMCQVIDQTPSQVIRSYIHLGCLGRLRVLQKRPRRFRERSLLYGVPFRLLMKER